jgi:hypothetical protein
MAALLPDEPIRKPRRVSGRQRELCSTAKRSTPLGCRPDFPLPMQMQGRAKTCAGLDSASGINWFRARGRAYWVARHWASLPSRARFFLQSDEA